MLGDKQDQSVESGSTAIQAGRDVHYHGLSVVEVRELCGLFLRDNFPRLREEACRTAEEQVRAFASTLESRLLDDATSVALEKLREPDVQAAINDAVQASARKGQAANPQLLAALISERVAKHTNNYKDIVLSEAVQVVPRLTAAQIALLSFIHFTMSMVFRNLPNVGALEQHGLVATRFSVPAFGLSESQKQHLQYAGAASIIDFRGGDIYEGLRHEYSYFGFTDTATFKQELQTQAPTFAKLLDQFSADNLYTVTLTSVGQAIALANISNYFGKLDYTIWLK